MAQWNTDVLSAGALLPDISAVVVAGVFNLAHLFLAGMGMYFLAQHWMGNRLAAAVAVVFAFNGLTWHSLMWPNDIAGWAGCPMGGAHDGTGVAGRQQARGVGGAGGRDANAGRRAGNHFADVAVARRVVAGTFLCGRFSRVSLILRAAAGLLVAGIAAAQLLPFLVAAPFASRHGFRRRGELGDAVVEVGNFLVPLFHCFAASRGVFVQYDQYWISSHYLGAGLMALALAGAWGARKRRVWLLLAVAVASVVMALGSHGFLYPVVKAVVPQMGFIRYQSICGGGDAGDSAAGGEWRAGVVRGTGQFNAERKALQIILVILLALMGLVWGGMEISKCE